MSQRSKIWIIVAVALCLLVTAIIFMKPSNKKEQLRHNQAFKPDGTFLLHQLIQNYKATDSISTITDPLYENLNYDPESDTPYVYILTEEALSISNNDADTLMDFVAQGNVALISVETMDYNLRQHFFYYDYLRNSTWQDSIGLNFYHDSFLLNRYYHIVNYESGVMSSENWRSYIITQSPVEEDIAVISHNEDGYPVYVRIPHGEGYFYFHSVPKVFYNYSVYEPEGKKYIERVLSHLPRGRYIWHSADPRYDPPPDFDPEEWDYDRPRNKAKRESPLKYILANGSLKWAYLLMIAGMVLFIMFNVKRRQKAIPAIEPNINNSLDYTKTISQLYLAQSQHNKFAKHYERSFLDFIRQRYYINSSDIDEKFMKRVAEKSQIDEAKIKAIFGGFKQAQLSMDYSDSELIDLHKNVEYFYKKCV